jgi:hypothetical protein
MPKETAKDLARKCTMMVRRGRSFPTVWRTILKRHILVGNVPTQRFEHERTLVDIPLTTGERLIFDREGKEFRVEQPELGQDIIAAAAGAGSEGANRIVSSIETIPPAPVSGVEQC